MQIILLIPLLTATFKFASAASSLGCYSKIPSSYESKGSYIYQSSSYCGTLCLSYSFFATTQGNTCLCGNEAPDPSDSADTCDTACFGYGQEKCGGANSFNVYSVDLGGAVAGSSAGTVSSGTTQSSQTSKTTATSTTANTPATATTAPTAQTTSTKETTITAEGGSTIVTYYTVAPSSTGSTPASSSSSSSSTDASQDHNKSSKSNIIGPAVGGAVGGIVLIVLIVVGFLFYRRRQAMKKEAELADSAYFSALKRNNTTNTNLTSPGHARQISNPFIGKDESMVDQRLNPVMINSRRRLSEGSLPDEVDYSRKMLRVSNPDD